MTEPIERPPGSPAGPPPYTVAEARQRLGAMARRASAEAANLPDLACPNDFTVATVTLHPSFLSKTGFPQALLADENFVHLGSRPTKVVPAQQARRVKKTNDVEYFHTDELRDTTELFVATTRANLSDWAQHLTAEAPEQHRHDNQLVRLERFDLNTPAERNRLAPQTSAAEIVLHHGNRAIVEGLLAFCEGLDVDLLIDRRFEAGTLLFVPARGEYEALQQITNYSFTRIVRAVPAMSRLLMTPPEAVRSISREHVELPTEGPLDSSLRVAVFDGGLPEDTVLQPWVTSYPVTDGQAVDNYVTHGHDVTSALLFGSVDPDQEIERPYSHVDHYQVLDSIADADDPFELYSVITRIETILSQRNYDFVSISIGPDLPIEDDEVHAWTAFWDSHLADGGTLLTIAIGNNGHLDVASGNARVQVPSDSVNALAVGAADSTSSPWNRAKYSALGPGRAPGVVKPDVVAFGGSTREPFVCVDPDGDVRTTCGTSFASPLALRAALGVRALFGDMISPLALKALLVHTAESAHTLTEVGRGRIVQPIGAIAACSDGEARVVYQGELTAKKFLRAQIPVPHDLPKSGKITITATIAYSTEVDPSDPGNYTRSGLNVVFRPHRSKFNKPTDTSAASASFFKQHEYETEEVLRKYSQKWDTVMHARSTKLISSVDNPTFDIHFNARTAGQDLVSAHKIRYAMVITVSCGKVPDLYDRVLRTYATQLQALQPAINIPITT
ncbi:S8 family peptidase [Mycolicibacter minnesotensis]